MDWKSLIADLVSSGLSQKEIGLQIGLTQPSVSALAAGVTKRLEFTTGTRLLKLHKKVMAKKVAA